MRTHEVLALIPLLIVALSAGCSKPERPASTSQGPTLSGPNVIRYPTPPYFRERERYVLKGERTANGCRYRSTGKAGFGAEWVVEQARDSSCTQVRARGDVIGPTELPSGNRASDVRAGPRNRP
jgi:hypothetical protein